MDQDNIDYLKQIQERMIAYDSVRAEVLDYVLEHQIKNGELATNLFIMGFLHEAHHREEMLTDRDINLFLGISEDIDLSESDPVTYTLEPKQSELELYDLLDLTVKNFSVD